MSNTFSELAATALIESLGAQPETGRHVVTTIHGQELADVFRTVLSHANNERSFKTGEGSPTTLQVLDNGDGCIIVPYLVQDPPPVNLRDNRGSQGFVSALRDTYSNEAADNERLMLLVFSSSPNETLLTTMSQGVADSSLKLDNLLGIALRVPTGASQALRRTATELARLLPTEKSQRLSPELVGRAAQAVNELAAFERTEEVARELYRIPWCLSDPRLFEYTGSEYLRRIKSAIRTRLQLENWATDPGTDFDSQVRKSYSSGAADKVVMARIGTTIDWLQFTLDDLLGGAPGPEDEDTEEDSLEFAAMPITVQDATATKLLAEGKTIVVQIPGPGCTITFNLTGPLTDSSTIHVIGYQGDEPPFTEYKLGKVTAADDNSSLVIEELPQPRPGWSFLEAVLTKGRRIVKKPLDSVRIAISIGTADDALVYEADGIIDLEAQAYSGDESLNFVAEHGGEEIWTQQAEPPEEEFGTLIPLRGETPAPGIQTQLDDDSADDEHVASPEHLAIDQWAAGVLPPGELSASLRHRPEGVVVADIGPVSIPVIGSESMPASRWALEKHVIDNPRTVAFRISNEALPRPDIDIEGLALGDLQDPFDEYLAARENFFAELSSLKVPSILAANLADNESAVAYVNSYERLLAKVPNDQPSRLGYDKIILTDSIITDSGELFIAPTSPLTVALHMQFQGQVRDWLANPPAINYFAGDIGMVSPQSLVPYLRLHYLSERWLESGYAPYPWRRYLPFTERARQERHPSLRRYIARRIERFLDVHPSYADERRTLRLAFINPGSAGHVRDSLLQLITPYLKKRGGEGLKNIPALDLQLLSDGSDVDSLLGTDLDLFMSFTPEEGQPSDAALEVMKRLSYTKGSASEFLQDPKAFAHITFLEDYFQPRPELVEWPADAHPTSLYAQGLAADNERLAKIEPGATRFIRATWTGGEGNSSTGRIAARTTEVSAAAAGVPVKAGIVRAADVLVPDSQIPQLYDRSAWVVHIDRHVGLELFAPQSQGSTAPYILDYTDQETPEPGVFDGITATSHVAPYRARIADVLGKAVDQAVPEAAAEQLLRTLNLISGRWGLELLRTPDNVLRGRLATALTAQVLEQVDELYADPAVLTLIVALDELLRVTGAEGLPTKAGWAAKAGLKGRASDDLLILTVPLTSDGSPRLTGRIIEVKYRSSPGSSAETAATQLNATHRLLSETLGADNQPGRTMQGRHLAKLILGYASRHVAYGVRSQHPAITTGTRALNRIAAGDYDLDLQIHRSGKVLAGDYVSVEPTLDDTSLAAQITTAAGIDIGRIRIGAPVIAAMLQTGYIPRRAHNEPGSVASNLSTGTSDGTRVHEGEDKELAGAAEEVPGMQPGEGGELTKTESPGSGVRETTNALSFNLPMHELRELAGRLDDVLTSYSLPLQPVQPNDAVCGPNTIRFRIRMARGGTIAQVEARERDILRELGLSKPIMVGQEAGFVTLDVPRENPVIVKFGDLKHELERVSRTRGQLPVIFGVDVAGQSHIEDLAQLPHLLVAGSTGSGKSVFLSSLLGSLAMTPPEELEIVLVDVKGLDFAPFATLPHLRRSPIDNATEALEVLDELYESERAKRRQTLADVGAQSILDYFTRLGGTSLTQIVIVVDEFSNLLGGDRGTGSRLEDTIQRYAEVMRSFGVYLVIATQRPSADIVTGRIKSNLPARCALRLPTHNDSMTILGRKGAEQLLGKGDMLFYRDGQIERLQAALTTAPDVLANYA